MASLVSSIEKLATASAGAGLALVFVRLGLLTLVAGPPMFDAFFGSMFGPGGATGVTTGTGADDVVVRICVAALTSWSWDEMWTWKHVTHF